MSAQYEVGKFTDRGNSRLPNMDAVNVSDADGGGIILAVADGMGGPGGGETASREALTAALRTCSLNLKHGGATAIRQAFDEAVRAVVDKAESDPSLSQMGTTLVLVAIKGTEGHVGWIGDSRAVLFRGDYCFRLTNDHLALVEEDGVPENRAKGNPGDNVLARAIDPIEPGKPDISSFDVMPGDRLVLFSDGVTEHVNEADIAEVIFALPPDRAAEEIVRLAVKRKSHDHSTALVAIVNSVDNGATA